MGRSNDLFIGNLDIEMLNKVDGINDASIIPSKRNNKKLNHMSKQLANMHYINDNECENKYDSSTESSSESDDELLKYYSKKTTNNNKIIKSSNKPINMKELLKPKKNITIQGYNNNTQLSKMKLYDLKHLCEINGLQTSGI